MSGASRTSKRIDCRVEVNVLICVEKYLHVMVGGWRVFELMHCIDSRECICLLMNKQHTVCVN